RSSPAPTERPTACRPQPRGHRPAESRSPSRRTRRSEHRRRPGSRRLLLRGNLRVGLRTRRLLRGGLRPPAVWLRCRGAVLGPGRLLLLLLLLVLLRAIAGASGVGGVEARTLE